MSGEASDQEHAAHPTKTVDTPYRAFVVDLLGDDKRHPSWLEVPPEKLEDGDPDRDTRHFVTRVLTEWLTKVAAANHPGATAKVEFRSSLPSDLKPNELYVYLCGVGASKFGATAAKLAKGVKGVEGVKDEVPPAQGLTGLRDAPGKGKRLLCEVWPGTIPGGKETSPLTDEKSQPAGGPKFRKLLAQLIFHEWMHFKMDADVAHEVVHPRGRRSLGGVPINDDSPNEPTTSDTDDMAADLGKEFKFFGAP